MNPLFILTALVLYFALLILIAKLTESKSDNKSFFLAGKQSPWYIVAYGMIGASLSGVTFISVPGWVQASQFSYMQMVMGYMLGYFIIATVLMPMYYKLNLTSIYSYLLSRFGNASYKTGASFFLLSRTIGTAVRLYLVAIVFQLSIFDKLDINFPFALTVILTIFLIWVYTYKGGLKTIIWTDTLQTTFLLLAVIITIISIANQLDLGVTGLISTISESSYSQIFFFDDVNDKKFFVKQFLAGASIAVVMTGLDQDMMQKNLSCKNIGEAQKNMFWFSVILLFVNLLFMCLGALLYIFSSSKGIEISPKADELYPMLAIEGYLGTTVALFFVIGLIAAAYSSADSALTALTTSFCVDILDIEKKDESKQISIRKKVHIGISIVMALFIIYLGELIDESVISKLFDVASFTYGPLLGMYAFGLFTKWQVKDKMTPFLCIASPLLCLLLKIYSKELFNGFEVGFEVLILNGLFVFVGMLIFKKP